MWNLLIGKSHHCSLSLSIWYCLYFSWEGIVYWEKHSWDGVATGFKLPSSCSWNCRLCRMEPTLFLCYWYINYFFAILINFTIHILNGSWYSVEAPLKKSNKIVTSQKEKGTNYKNETTTEFWYAFIQADQCTI